MSWSPEALVCYPQWFHGRPAGRASDRPARRSCCFGQHQPDIRARTGHAWILPRTVVDDRRLAPYVAANRPRTSYKSTSCSRKIRIGPLHPLGYLWTPDPGGRSARLEPTDWRRSVDPLPQVALNRRSHPAFEPGRRPLPDLIKITAHYIWVYYASNSNPRCVKGAMATLPCSTATDHGYAALAGLGDMQLADWLKEKKRDKKDVVLVYAGTTCHVYEKSDVRGNLLPADPEGKAKSAFKALANQNRLFTLEITPSQLAGASMASASWVPTAASAQHVDDLLEQRKVRLGRVNGRGDSISLETANRVWADAGGCCMFKGCAADLSTVPLHNSGARVGYLAHIVASDPRGPRGNEADSHRLSNNPENIMLMCDAHHRLIDCFSPGRFDAARLRQMRREHTEMVNRYRIAMRLPVAQVMTFFADLAGIPTHCPDSEFMETLLAEGFAMHAEVKRHLTYHNRDDRTTAGFWANYLREMELAIGTMVRELSRGGAHSPDRLAIFPLHHTPTLVLAGRIVGEARKVLIFQPSRTRKSWMWNTAAPLREADTFKVTGLTSTAAAEVLLTVELTAHLDEDALPASLAALVTRGDLPRIRVTTDNPSGECLQRKEDLALVLDAARLAINSIQDQMRAQRVHLIALCPASAAFSLGQLMQAGHHAAFVLYDRPNRETPFREAFTINGYSVISPAGADQISISIR